MRRVLLGAALALAAPGVAAAAPPANDAPAGAADFMSFTAGNLPAGQTAGEQQGLVDLTEATPDAGVARCLGAKSMAKTVWFRVPAGTVPRVVHVEASSPSQGTAEVPDLALFVGGQSVSAQSCDGPARGELATSAAAVEARVPAGQTALVQVGRSAGQSEQRVVASLRVTDLPATAAPAGDVATSAPRLLRSGAVPLFGATLTAEDPAQPACPAAATVWRRTPVRVGGTQLIVATGAAVGTLTAFVGRTPDADNAVACANRETSRTTLAVPAQRGDVLWTRVGADAPAAGAATTLRVTGPRASLRIRSVRVRGARAIVRLRAVGAPAKKVRVRVVGRGAKRVRRVGLAGRRVVVRLRESGSGRVRVKAAGRAAGRRVTATRPRA